MGISPYINASIVVQLLTYSIPRLEQFRQEGLVGKKKLDKITYGLACILAVVQAYGFTTLLIRDNMLTRSDVFCNHHGYLQFCGWIHSNNHCRNTNVQNMVLEMVLL